MKKLLLSFAILPFVFIANANTDGSIRGRLFDSQTREPLLFSNVVLIKDVDSSFVAGVITDENGLFLLENLRDGTYRLRVTNIGYHPYTSHSIELTRNNNRLDLGTFFINPSTSQLTEVVIEAVRPVFEQLAGKFVFNVAQSLTSVGDDALETLKRIPGITVDNEDNISLHGSSSVTVMIDDRPTRMSGAQLANLLKSLPSSSIERIEVIDNPSARYEAEGTGGIINIKTSRVRMMGYSGTVFAGLRYHGDFQHNEGFDLSYRSGKITVFGNFNILNQNTPISAAGYTVFPDGTRWERNTVGTKDWGMYQFGNLFNGRAGFDYYFNPRSILSLSYRLNDGRFDVEGTAKTRIFTPGNNVQSSFVQNQNSTHDRGTQNLSLNFQHIFDSINRRQFFLDASWVRNYQTGGSNTEVTHYWGDFETFWYRDPFYIRQPLTSNIFSIKGDLEYPLNKNTKFETGARYSFVRNENDQTYFVDDVLNPDMTNHYVYLEHITAFYGMVTHTLSPRLSFEAGLRGEYTTFRGHNRTIDSVNTNSYFGVFPTLNINQKISQNSGLNLSYRYRLTRPNYMDLNPIMMRNAPFVFTTGYPYLKPEYAHSLRLAYLFNNFPIVRITYDRSDGDIRRLTYYHGDTAFARPENIGQSSRISLALMAERLFFESWRSTVSFTASYSWSEFMYDNKPEKSHNYQSSVNWNNDIRFSRTMSMELIGVARFPQKMLFTTTSGMYFINVGFRKSFFDRSLTVTASLLDIFDTGGRSNSTFNFPNGIHVYSEQFWAGRTASIRLSYRFGKGQVQTRRMREAAQEEVERMGGSAG